MSNGYQYLLDTNIISDLMKNPQGDVVAQISRVGEDTICTSIIVAAELEFGVERKGSDKLKKRLSMILSAIASCQWISLLSKNMVRFVITLKNKEHPLERMIY